MKKILCSWIVRFEWQLSEKHFLFVCLKLLDCIAITWSANLLVCVCVCMCVVCMAPITCLVRAKSLDSFFQCMWVGCVIVPTYATAIHVAWRRDRARDLGPRPRANGLNHYSENGVRQIATKQVVLQLAWRLQEESNLTTIILQCNSLL